MSKIVPRRRSRFWKRATRTRTASSQGILTRTIGIETEYAFRSTGEVEHSKGKDSRCIAAEVLLELSRQSACAISSRNPLRRFVSNGGCFSLENAGSFPLHHALLEAATPECNSPLEAVIYQAAMREMVQRATQRIQPETVAIQGNHDANRHRYGQHESYDILVANGIWLWAWRFGLAFLLPFVAAMMISKMSSIAFLRLVSKIETCFRRSLDERTANQPGNASPTKEFEDSLPSAFWLGLVATWIRWNQWPIALLLWLNIQLFAMRPYRKHLFGFLASRCMLDGAGVVQEDGRFSVSCRAGEVNCKVGFGSLGAARPLLRCDAWLKKMCPSHFADFRDCFSLFRQRQRVEIAIGDSGLSQLSQIVRIGATALVLDLIESSTEALLLPILRDPVESIDRFSRDWMLVASQQDRDNSQWSALDLQDSYACAVTQMLQTRSSVPSEAWQILQCWQQSLNLVRVIANEECVPTDALGRIDWATKLWVLTQSKETWDLAAKRKLDLRYHELSSKGYFSLLTENLPAIEIISPSLIIRAIANPPKSSSSAIQRSYLLREFGSNNTLVVDWDHASCTLNGHHCVRRFR